MSGLSPKLAFRFFFSSRRRHTRFDCDWSSDVCSSDLHSAGTFQTGLAGLVVSSPPGFRVCFARSEEHTSELQSQSNLVCRLLLEKKKKGKMCRVECIAKARVIVESATAASAAVARGVP